MVVIHFNARKSVIVVPARLTGEDGRTWRVRLALDTGSTFLVLSNQYCRKLGCAHQKIRPRKMITTTAVKNSSFEMVIVPKVEVGGETVENVEAVLMNLPLNRQADGLLGLSFLQMFHVELDIHKGILVLERLKTKKRRKNRIRSRVRKH